MRLDEYSKHDALGLAELVAKGETTPAELRQAALDGIARVNPALNAVLQVLADASAKEVAAGIPTGPFQGVPFLIKELMCHAAGVPLDFGSRLAARRRLPARHRADGALPPRRPGPGRHHADARARLQPHHRDRAPRPGPQSRGCAGAAPADRAAARRRRSRPASCRSRTPTTAAARSAFRRAATGWSA